MSEKETGVRALRFDRSWASVGILAVGFLVSYRGLLDSARFTSEFRDSLEQAIYNPAEGYPLIGVLVFLVLSRFRIELIRAAWGAAGSWVSGLTTLVIGTLLLGWAHQIAAVDLLMPALVLQLISVALILGGGALLRAIAVPLLALIVTIPLPPMAINLLVFPMQMVTVSMTSFLLSVVGRSYVVAGDLIMTNGIIFKVIEGCSGLKTMMSLALAGVVFAELTGRDWREKVVLIALAPLVGILANGFRVLILVLREVSAESVEHAAYGILMIVMGVVLLAVFEWMLSRTLFARWRQESAFNIASDPLETTHGQPGRRLAFLALIAILSCVFLQSLPIGRTRPLGARVVNIETLPREIDGWVAKGIRFDDSVLGSVWFRHRIYRSYEKDGTAIRVFVGLEDVVKKGRSGYSPKTIIPRSGWRSIQQNTVSSSRLTAFEGEVSLIRYPSGLVMVHHRRFGFAPWGLELFSGWLGLDRRFFGGSEVALVVRLETDVIGTDPTGAELRLRQMAENVEEWVRPLGRSGKTRNTRG